MKGVLSLFSWVASGLVEGLCPGGSVSESIAEELRRFRESAKKISEQMQKAWAESLKILEVALGGGSWVTPKSRKQFAEKFVKQVITPFAVKNKLIGGRLDEFLKKSLEQCDKLIKMKEELIDFTCFEEETLLDALSQTGKGISAEDMGILIIDRIQTRLPNAQELLELLWHRNLLLEGLIAHFNFILSSNSNLAELVARMDRQRIQQELCDIKKEMQQSLADNNLGDIAKLGARAAQLATTDEIYALQQDYRNLFGTVFEHLEQLSEDHTEIKGKLDQIIDMLSELEQIQRNRTTNSRIRMELALSKPQVKEVNLVNHLHAMVKKAGWDIIPEAKRTQAVNTLAVSLYSSEKVCQALTVLEEAIAQGVATVDVYFNYFQALQVSGRNDEAVVAYEKAVSLNPDVALFSPQRYKMTGIVGRGGMGVVYKAQSLEKDIPVAIKVLLLPEEWYPGARERFLQTARAAINLRHPNIVFIYNFEVCNPDRPYLIMEYLEGIDLQRKVKKHGPLSVQQGLKIAYAIAQGLKYAHQEGVIHRDLKPGNIVLTNEGPKIIDFGLAKWEKDSTLTLTGDVFYTLYYSSPEQRKDFHGVDCRSDIYSFGKTLYYLFTGDEPYDIDWEEVPRIVRPILRKATRKRPENRYAGMDELLLALDKAMEGQIEDSNGEDLGESDIFPVIYVQEPPTSKPPADIIEKLSCECVVEEQGTVISGKDESSMVYIPAGPFMMGDHSDRAELEEGPVHEVYLDAFLMDVYPVTNKRYRMFIEELNELGEHPSPWCHPDEPRNKIHIPQFWYSDRWNRDNFPVVGVDWWDAYAYCKWAKKDLPTEAEWEKAARGTDERIYPWGNEIPTPDMCNYGKIYKGTTEITKFQHDHSPYGCSNMSGNVWEWCFDWFAYRYYETSPSHNPKGPSSGRSRVGRGGCWMNDIRRIRTTTRAHGSSPGDRNHHLGFRAVKRL